MFHNRLSAYQARFEFIAAESSSRPASRSLHASQHSTLVMVPCVAQVASWQAALYQMAHQQAVAQLAPPRHMSRFFSQWN